MLLSQQAKLINLNSDSAEIAISEKWINMIQSRKNLIEDAFYKARGSSTKVLLIQQKDNLSNHKKVENNLQKIEPKNQIKIDREPNKNTIKEEKIESKNNFKVNSIDQKAKQFADFFNGEIVNLE
jgi:DNA polymerase-3 subunit gamma/tau